MARRNISRALLSDALWAVLLFAALLLLVRMASAQTQYSPAVGTAAEVLAITCDSTRDGRQWSVTDALSPSQGAVVVTGGAERVTVQCDSATALWTVRSCDSCGPAAGSGTSVILDLGDDDANESIAITELAVTGDTASIFTEPSADKLLVAVGNDWPNSATATALAANGANCAAGEIALGVGVDGAVEGCYEPAEADISDLSHTTDTTCSSAACAVGTDDTVTLPQGAAPTPTVEGRFEWEIDDDHLIVGDGVAAVEFVPAEDVSGDATMTDAGVVTVGDDSHAHTTTTVSGLDTSADTNLAVTAPVVLTDDTLSLTQNAGTDVTADLEEEAHAAEHAENAADEILIEALGTACTDGQIPKANATGGIDCGADATGGGGTPNILDLGDDAADESTDLIEIATTGDTNSIFTEPTADKLLIVVGNDWPNSATATALAANGSNCGAGNYPLGVDASGAVESCTADVDTDTQLSQEQVEDFAGALVTDGTGTHTGIAVTYQDVTGDVDLVIDHDAASNFVVAEHVDWAGASAGTIHATNYVDNDTIFSPSTLDTDYGAETITSDYDFGGGGIEIENGITPPACTEGQLFLDTDATAGQQLMACEAGTFVLQGDGGGAETNDLEATDPPTILDTELYIGTGAGTGAFAAVSGDATLANTGALTVVDDSHNHVIANVDAFTSAALRGQVSDESGTGAAIFAGGAIAAATATTPAADDNDTSVATTAYVQGEINGAGGTNLTCASGTCNVDALVAGDLPQMSACRTMDDVAAASDDVPFPISAGQAITLVSGFAHCQGTCTTEADFTLEVVEVGTAGPTVTAVTGTITAEDYITGDTATTLSGSTSVAALDVLRINTTNTPSPATDDYSICVNYTFQ